MNPIDAATQNAESVATQPLAWMVVFLSISGVLTICWIAKYLVIPFRDGVLDGHKECDRKLEDLSKFHRDTLVGVVQQNREAFEACRQAVQSVADRVERHDNDVKDKLR